MSKKDKKTRNKRVDIRMTDEEFARLMRICSKTGKNKTEAVIEGLRIYGNLTESQY